MGTYKGVGYFLFFVLFGCCVSQKISRNHSRIAGVYRYAESPAEILFEFKKDSTFNSKMIVGMDILYSKGNYSLSNKHIIINSHIPFSGDSLISLKWNKFNNEKIEITDKTLIFRGYNLSKVHRSYLKNW